MLFNHDLDFSFTEPSGPYPVRQEKVCQYQLPGAEYSLETRYRSQTRIAKKNLPFLLY